MSKRREPGRAARAPRGVNAVRRPVRHEHVWVALLVAAHLLLALWGAVKQSVTFDENFHLPSGMLIASRGEFRVSAVNPPLVKALAGAAALAAGAIVPPLDSLGSGEQGEVGVAFMRANAGHYQRMFVAGRIVVILLSGLLALLVWRWARRSWGARGALFSLALYAFAPEALAHAGVVTMDVPTALGFVLTLFGWQAFVTSGRWRAWGVAAVGLGFTFLVRFTAVFLPPLMLVLAILPLVRRRVRHAKRVGLGYALLVPSTLLALQAGYLGKTSWQPLREWSFQSQTFQSLQARFGGLVLPLPDAYVAGFDRQAVESQAGRTPSYLQRVIHPEAPLAYFPVALAAKWPLGFLAALAVLALYMVVRRPALRRVLGPLALAALFLWIGMFVGRLGIGIRYVFPIVPAFAVLAGALAAGQRGAAAWWRQAAVACAVLQAAETTAHAPWHLSFYNAIAGGPERGQWIVNDSNLDWGQGLIALREELAKRGIQRVYLSYHGTAEPSLYGIDYVPYMGGPVGRDADWMAISSYYYVGLSQRMMLPSGRTEQALQLDFRPLWSRRPEAMPAGCMMLYRLR